jgi:hypothetical protein
VLDSNCELQPSFGLAFDLGAFIELVVSLTLDLCGNCSIVGLGGFANDKSLVFEFVPPRFTALVEAH